MGRAGLILLLLLLAATPAASGTAPADALPSPIAAEPSLLEGLSCTVTVEALPPITRQPCWLADGVARPLAVPTTCRVAQTSAGRQQECVRAEAHLVLIDLGRYQPIGRLLSYWPRGPLFGDAVVEVMPDSRTWQVWDEVDPTGDLVYGGTGTPVWTRYLRVRALPPGPRDVLDSADGQVRRNTQVQAIDPVTGLIRPTGEKPRETGPDLLAEAPGTVAGLHELVVRPAGGDDPDDSIAGLLLLLGAVLLGFGVYARSEMRFQARLSAAAAATPQSPSARPVPARSAVRGLLHRGVTAVRPRPWPERVDHGFRGTLHFTARLAADRLAPLPLLMLLFLSPMLLIPIAGWLIFYLATVLAVFAGAVFCAVAFLLAAVSRALGGQSTLSAAGRTAGFALVYALIALFVFYDTLAGRDEPPGVRVAESVARAEPRALPASADPVAVVDEAFRLVSGPRPAAACGLLAPSARDRCRPDPRLGQDVTPRTSLVLLRGERAVVTYRTGFDWAAVRLESGASGWELLELPVSRPSGCLVSSLARGDDPLDC